MTEKKRKIGIIGPSPRFLSGISYFTMRLSNALAKRCTVSVVLFRHMLPKRLFPGWKRVGSDIAAFSYDDAIACEEILDWYNPLSWNRAARELRPCDVIIFQWWTSSVAHMYLALEARLRRKVPIVIEFHEVVDTLEQAVLPISIYAKHAGRWVRNRASAYVVHSEADRKLIADYYGIPIESVRVIPHGLFDQYPQLDPKEMKVQIGVKEEYSILFFGLLRPYKGVSFLIGAFEKLPEEVRKNCHLHIVGEAWEDRESIERAESSPYAGQITVVNRYVSDQEIPQYFSAADALVLPYTRASQSGVAHIGITYGMPIIASRVGGLEESLGKYDGTSFVAPSSEEDIARAIVEAYQTRKTNYPVPTELSWDNVAEEWCRFFDEIKV